MSEPRAGDTVIAVDHETAVAIAHLCKSGESPNACLRRLLDLPPLDTARHSKWRLKYLKEVRP
jgi:hypothetical protein